MTTEPMQMSAPDLKQELLALIALSEEMLAIAQEEEIDVNLLAEKEQQRSAGVQHFFQAYDKSAYQTEKQLLSTLQQLDRQILTRCNEYKQTVADQLIGFKKNQKAVNAYKGK
ncbi:hypothetical protein SG34_021860 [Thalassomonas viridans]|uniref:Flagellar protein FliT n=1 Tax=Thalassomonas viridans TaxID=137584 RepID=A0AAF0C7R9_9GAMM|nr:hypothetical protein [Thalassomonas viridans]WDE03988.1 hypothetical protein SG34_021860 [Thalassomonas viridans]